MDPAPSSGLLLPAPALPRRVHFRTLPGPESSLRASLRKRGARLYPPPIHHQLHSPGHPSHPRSPQRLSRRAGPARNRNIRNPLAGKWAPPSNTRSCRRQRSFVAVRRTCGAPPRLRPETLARASSERPERTCVINSHHAPLARCPRRAPALSSHLEARLHRSGALSDRHHFRLLRLHPGLSMRPLDWIVLFGTLGAIIGYGLYRARGSNTVDRYLLAGKSMPWYAMALSIMATQASAVTFISTTGQSYVDGMRFVQFYFGLPLAMIVICYTVVPVFHRAKVYTAYEYLEQRFDSKTRVLGSLIFLCQRGLSAGMTIYAPAIVLSVILGWPERMTTSMMGAVVVTYTVLGGIKAVTWSDVQQMCVILIGLVIALVTVLVLLPSSVSFTDAVYLAGAAGRLNAVTTTFNWSDRFNLWSGLFGGTFLFLSYFGCDQSQVQRYLTGKSIAQSRLSLLFNAIAKIPMQFFILFIGAMVFVFHIFVQPPVLFQRTELARIESRAEYPAMEAEYQRAFEHG